MTTNRMGKEEVQEREGGGQDKDDGPGRMAPIIEMWKLRLNDLSVKQQVNS